MENLAMSRQREESDVLGALKLPIMRALAKSHECDLETLFSMVDASELDVHYVLREMVSKREVEASPGSRSETFALTLKGWGEYMNALGSVYELDYSHIPAIAEPAPLTEQARHARVQELERLMLEAAADLRFEDAAAHRDELQRLKPDA